MNPDDRLRRAASRLNAELSRMPVPRPPKKSKRPALAVTLGAVASVAVIWGGAVMLRTGGGPVPVGGDSTTAATTATTAGARPSSTASTTSLPPEPGLYRGTVTVIDEGDNPVVCTVVLDSLPPQCGGLPLEGLDWSDVPWAETAQGVTWADMSLAATLEDGRLRIVEPPGPAEPKAGEEVDFTPPCEAPLGGWVWIDGPRSTDVDFQRAMEYVRSQPDLSAAWVYSLIDDPYLADQTGRQEVVLVAVFTGDTTAHEKAITALWGGPLCVSQGTTNAADLAKIQTELTDLVQGGSVPGIYGFGWSYADDRLGKVVLGAIIVTPEARQWVAGRYAPDLVRYEAILQPVD